MNKTKHWYVAAEATGGMVLLSFFSWVSDGRGDGINLFDAWSYTNAARNAALQWGGVVPSAIRTAYWFFSASIVFLVASVALQIVALVMWHKGQDKSRWRNLAHYGYRLPLWTLAFAFFGFGEMGDSITPTVGLFFFAAAFIIGIITIRLALGKMVSPFSWGQAKRQSSLDCDSGADVQHERDSFCTVCGRTLSETEDIAFCPGCGTKKVAPKNSINCPHCHRLLEGVYDAEFCYHCGEEVNSKTNE